MFLKDLAANWYLIVWYAIALHLIWATALFLDPTAVGVTGLYSIVILFGYYGAIAAMISAALIAACGTVTRNLQNKYLSWIRPFSLIPQQFLLTIAATGVMYSVWVSHFADGIVRSRGFLIADQIPSILTAIFHSLVIYKIMKENNSLWK